MKPVIFLLFLFFSIVLSAQTRYYVNPLAMGAGTGLSWTDAFTDLHEALVVAQKGDEVWVAQGTYYPSLTGDRSARFVLLSGVRLYGGFRGTELDLSERDWEAHPTVIDGDIGVPGDSTDNTRTLLYLPWPDSSTVVDGLVFRHGVADDTLVAVRSLGNCGGAIFIQGINGEAYANIRNCVFQRNTAVYCGGAVYIHGTATGSVAPTFENCRFEDNRAVWGPGGAIHRFGGSVVDRADVIRCAFVKNVARKQGAAVYWWAFGTTGGLDISETYFKECNLESAHSPYLITPGDLGGDALAVISPNIWRSSVRITKSKFLQNRNIRTSICHIETISVIGQDSLNFTLSEIESAHNEGSSYNVYLLGNAHFSVSDFISSQDEIPGFFFSVYSVSGIKISEVVFKRVFIRKAIGYRKIEPLGTLTSRFWFDESAVLEECFFDIKTMNGLFFETGLLRRLAFRNVLLSNASPSFVAPSIVAPSIDSLSIVNSRANNIRATAKNVRFINNIFGNTVLQEPVNSSTITHNLFTTPDPFPNAPGTWLKEHNLFETDPMFVQPDSGDFRLQPCSPAINAGTNSAVDWSTDLLGNPRIQYGRVDIGAVEMGPLAFEGGGPSVRPACPGLSTGRIDASALPVCPPATYSWSTGSSGAVVENLSAGTYTLSVVDAKGRDGVFVIVVPSASSPVLVPQSLPVQCGDTLGGTAAVSVSGAPGPFAFEWAGLSADSVQSNLPPGVYRVTVTDAYGCTSAGSVKVDRQGALSIQIDVSPIRCLDSADGYLTVLPANGKGPFTWSWSQPAGATGPTVGPLGPGLYVGTLTDAFGCQIGWSLPLTDPLPLSAQITVLDATDTLAANGSIQLALSGGAGGYVVHWSNGGTGLHLLGLRPGVYVATITDANGCQLETPPIVVGVKTGVSEAAGVLWGAQLQPNPALAGTWLALERPAEREVAVRLWSVEGRLLRSWVLLAGVQQMWLPLADMPAGTYSLECEGSALLLLKR